MQIYGGETPGSDSADMDNSMMHYAKESFLLKDELIQQIKQKSLSKSSRHPPRAVVK